VYQKAFQAVVWSKCKDCLSQIFTANIHTAFLWLLSSSTLCLLSYCSTDPSLLWNTHGCDGLTGGISLRFLSGGLSDLCHLLARGLSLKMISLLLLTYKATQARLNLIDAILKRWKSEVIERQTWPKQELKGTISEQLRGENWGSMRQEAQ
jgi:hypothetical protein